MRNRFYNIFYNNLKLEAVMPGWTGMSIGQIFNIKIPTPDQASDITAKLDETLTGDWLLYQMKHVINGEGNNCMTYETHCTFIKTGLEECHRPLKQSFGS